MKYTNGFQINATGAECFITFLQTQPKGQTKSTEEVETLVMSEGTAKQLILALAQVYNKVDADRAAKKDINIKESSGPIS